MSFLLQVQPAQDTGDQISSWLGRLLPVVLLGLGVMYCGVILRRPRVNRKGVVALGLALLALFLMLLNPSDKKSVAGTLWFLTWLSCTLASAVLAIWALVNVGGPANRYVEGRGQAVAALILLAPLVLPLLFAAFKGTVEFRKGAPVSVGQSTELRFKTLPAPWVQVEPRALAHLDPQTVYARASLAVTRTDPEMTCILITEQVEVGATVDVDLYVRTFKASLLPLDLNVSVPPLRPETINGISGFGTTTSAEVGRAYVNGVLTISGIFYRYWIYHDSGRVYQVLAAGNSREWQRILKESDALFSNLELPARKK